MFDKILIGAIGAAGVIVGAVLSSIAAAYSARQKIRELELKYLEEKRNRYLANARQHVVALYIPLNAALTRLIQAYERFRDHLNFDTGKVDESRRTEFRNAIEAFVEHINGLFTSGADAFLTNELAEALRSFKDFLLASAKAERARRRLLMAYKVPVVPFGRSYVSESRSAEVGFGQKGREMAISILGFGFTLRTRRLQPRHSSPVNSRNVWLTMSSSCAA